MDYTALPITPEFTPELARNRASQLLNRQIPPQTFRRWRRDTGLDGGWMTEEQVWMLAIYGRCLSQYRRSKEALNAANKLIEESRNAATA